MRYCLDSWVVLRWLEGRDPAFTWVKERLADRPVMSWINLGEVLYSVDRSAGRQQASRVVANLRRRLDLDLPSERRVIEAAMIKATHRMSYADAFAVATALAHEATLATGDPEILGAGADWSLEDLRV